MKIVHINREKKADPAEALAKQLAAKWERKDREAAAKEYTKEKRKIK